MIANVATKIEKYVTRCKRQDGLPSNEKTPLLTGLYLKLLRALLKLVLQQTCSALTFGWQLSSSESRSS